MTRSAGHTGSTGHALTVARSAALWGPAAFAVAAAAAARRHPGYDHRRDHVSGLAARGTRSAPVMVAGFAALGVAELVMKAPTPAARRLVRLAGAATLVAGACRASTPACPAPFLDPTADGGDLAHGVASLTAFTCWLALPVVTARAPGPPSYRAASAALVVPTAVAYVVAGVTTRAGSPRKGVAQRALLGCAFTWHAATAAASSAASPAKPPRVLRSRGRRDPIRRR